VKEIMRFTSFSTVQYVNPEEVAVEKCIFQITFLVYSDEKFIARI
jgi:hypothetical protein